MRSTRWQGTTIGIGLAPSALPAARTARSLPAPVGHLAIGGRAAVRDPRRGLQHAAGEAVGQPPVQRRVERAPRAGEVLVQLAPHGVEAGRRLDHARGDAAGEAIEQRSRWPSS